MDDFNQLVSIKINSGAHVLLRYCPTLGVQMQDFASRAIINRFSNLYPELYEQIRKRHAPEWERAINELIVKVEGELKLEDEIL